MHSWQGHGAVLIRPQLSSCTESFGGATATPALEIKGLHLEATNFSEDSKGLALATVNG